METSRRQISASSRQSMLLLEERRASLSASTDTVEEWMTLAASCPIGFVKLLLAATQDGLFGKMCRTSLGSTGEKHLPPSFKGWSNSGIAVPGECWTLNTSEYPNDAVGSSLSEIIDHGDCLLRSYLSQDQIENMLRRLKKYKQENELTDALRAALSDGMETKLPSTE